MLIGSGGAQSKLSARQGSTESRAESTSLQMAISSIFDSTCKYWKTLPFVVCSRQKDGGNKSPHATWRLTTVHIVGRSHPHELYLSNHLEAVL